MSTYKDGRLDYDLMCSYEVIDSKIWVKLNFIPINTEHYIFSTVVRVSGHCINFIHKFNFPFHIQTDYFINALHAAHQRAVEIACSPNLFQSLWNSTKILFRLQIQIQISIRMNANAEKNLFRRNTSWTSFPYAFCWN